MMTALVLMAFGLVVVVMAQWPADVAALNRGGSALSFSGSVSPSRAATASLALAAWALGILLLARWSPLRSALGARLPRSDRPWWSLARISTVYVAAALGSQYILAWVTDDTSSSSTSEVYATYSFLDRLVSGVWAGSWEETFDVAVPIGLACFAWWVLRTIRAPFGTLVGPPQRVPFWCLFAGLFGLVTRYLDHLYQGSGPAAAVVGMGVVAVVLFAWGGSVVPLIVGHVIYDVLVAARPVLPSGEPLGAAVNWACLVLLFMATFLPLRRTRTS
jgi:hypothetical protein